MIVKCLHGYFIIRESKPGDVSKFMSLFPDADLVSKDDYFTFDLLSEAETYSLVGAPYLGIPAIVTYEGTPWEVMRANGIIYDFTLGIAKLISTVTNVTNVSRAANYYLSSGLIVPGSLKDDGTRVKDYSAWFSLDKLNYKYTELSYE